MYSLLLLLSVAAVVLAPLALDLLLVLRENRGLHRTSFQPKAKGPGIARA